MIIYIIYRSATLNYLVCQKTNLTRWGGQGFSIALHFVLGLRENQLDQNGQPFVICTDEVLDEQVVIESPPQEIQKSFLDSFVSQARRRGFHDLPDRAESYTAVAISLGTAILGLEQTQVIELLTNKLNEDTKLYPDDKVVLSDKLANYNKDNCDLLTQYLQFSQTQMTNEEQRILYTAQKKASKIGDKSLEIDGETYRFAGSGQPPIEINESDKQLIVPLQKAVKKSRMDMVEQARETAFQYLGIDREKNGNKKPPSWWIKGENGEGLRSDELLIYVPYDIKTTDQQLPSLIRNLLRTPDFRKGWNILSIPKDNPNIVVGISNLVD